MRYKRQHVSVYHPAVVSESSFASLRGDPRFGFRPPHRPPATRRASSMLALSGQTDAPEQVLKARFGTQGIEDGVDLETGHNI